MKRTQEKIAQAVQSYLETGDASALVALPARIENRIKRCGNAMLWAFAANSSIFSVKVSGRARDLAPGLRDLLLPIAALKEYGTSEEIAATIGDFKRVIEKMGDEAPPILEEKVADLERTRAAMATAEEILHDANWKFDLKTGKAKRIEKRDAEGFFAACVRAIYKAPAKRLNNGNTTFIREKIAATLAPWFDEEELSSASGAPIYRVIDKGERRSR